MSEDSKASGLMEWMNTFPEVNALGLTSFLNTRDGFAIATLWNCISPKKIDLSSLGKPSSETDWLTIRKNLGIIDTVITPVLTEKKLRPSERIDLTAIARKSQIDDLIRLVEPLVMVSLSCSIKKDVVTRIKGLSPNGRKVIKTVIESFKRPDTKPAPAPEPSPEATDPPVPVDEATALERETAAAKQRIKDLHEKLKLLQEQSEKMYRKANQGQAQEISEMEQRLEDTVSLNNDLEARIAVTKKREEDLERRLAVMLRKQEVLKEVKERYRQEAEAKRSLEQKINAIDDAIARKRALDSKLVKIREEREKQQREAELMDGFGDEEIRHIKDDIKATVDLEDKYGAPDDGTEPSDADDNEETVTELAARISQMEIEITILNDEIASGRSGIPKDTQMVHAELQKVIAQLRARKSALEDEQKLSVLLREDLQRVQTMIVSQREEIESEIAALARTVNAQNLDLTGWISYANAFDAWESSRTFMDGLKNQYL